MQIKYFSSAVIVVNLLFAAPAVYGAPLTNLNFLKQLSTGTHQFQADSETFNAHVDNDGTLGWLLVGRGRNGWEFDNDGQGAVADVGVQANLGTPAAFAPALYRDAIVNDLIGNSGIDLTNVEIRFRRAGNSSGTAYQEARWRPSAQTSWIGEFDIAGTGYAVEHEILSGIGGPAGPGATNTRDAINLGNNFTRIFTWSWNGHGFQQGFSYGNVTTDGANNATNFWWEAGNENHALPYTEVFIRNINEPNDPLPSAVPEPSTFALATLSLLGLGMTRRRKRIQSLILSCLIVSMTFGAAGPHTASAALIHHYTFDNAANLGEDSVGSRDLSVQNVGAGGAVSQVGSVTDGNSNTHFGIARITDETPHSQTSNTTAGSWLEHNTGGSTTLANFTVAMWFRTDVNQNDGFSSMFSNGPNTGNNNFQIDNGDNLGPPDDIRLNGRNGVSITDTASFSTDDWFHLAVTYDGTDTRFYIDGSQFGAAIAANPGNEFQEIRVGSNRNELRLFDGDFEDVRIYDNSLNAAEIAALATFPSSATSTPEPSTAILATLGLLSLGMTRRRRRR